MAFNYVGGDIKWQQSRETSAVGFTCYAMAFLAFGWQEPGSQLIGSTKIWLTITQWLGHTGGDP